MAIESNHASNSALAGRNGQGARAGGSTLPVRARFQELVTRGPVADAFSSLDPKRRERIEAALELDTFGEKGRAIARPRIRATVEGLLEALTLPLAPDAELVVLRQAVHVLLANAMRHALKCEVTTDQYTAVPPFGQMRAGPRYTRRPKSGRADKS